MASYINPTGAPYIGVGAKRRGDHIDPTLESKRIPGQGAYFERTKRDVLAVQRPITQSEIRSRIGSAPTLSNAENNHEFFSNFKVMHSVRDMGSTVTDRAWLQGLVAFVQSKLFSSATQMEVSPFEFPQGADGFDPLDPFSFVLDSESEDTYGAVRVMTPSYLNLVLQSEKKTSNLDPLPTCDAIFESLGITLQGVVNNQVGTTGPGYGSSNLRGRDLVNFCVEGQVDAIPLWEMKGKDTNGSLKGMKVYAIIKRVARLDFSSVGLTKYYVPDNSNGVSYQLKPAGNDFVNKPFQVFFVMRRHVPDMSELLYTDDNGYLRRAKVIFLGCMDYVHQWPCRDPRNTVNDLSDQAKAGLVSIILDIKEIEFFGKVKN